MRVAALAVLLVLAGCVSPATTLDPGAVAADILPTLVQDHDHLDAALHADASGLAVAGAHTLATDGGPRGSWMTTEIIVVGDYAYVAYLGAPWLLAILDVRDAANPVLVSQWETANAWGMDLAVSDDGNWVYVAVYPHATGELFTPGYTLEHVGVPNGLAMPGLAVVDARDKASPALSSFMPVQGLGPHTVGYHKYPDGREVVFANKADLQVGNAVTIAEVVETPLGGRALRPLSVYMLEGPITQNQPHDVDAAEHPVTGQTLLYIAYTWAGAVIIDITDPSDPQHVATTKEGPEPDGADGLIHDIHPYPTLVDGVHYTFAAPEIITGETSGTLRVYDTTDPAAPALVGTWEMAGEYVTDEPFGFSTHNFVFLPDGRVALAHGHAGVWIVDWQTDPTAPLATAYYAGAFPDATPPAWAPVHGTPWYWGTAVDARGVLWASDAMGGIVSLREAAVD